MSKKRFILKHHRSPGDIMCLTSLVRDIHLTHPGKFETDVDTTVKPIWDGNPYLTKLWQRGSRNKTILKPNTVTIKCDYGKGLREQNKETIHFASYFHRDFEKQTGIHVDVHKPHGDLFVSDYEKKTPPVNGRYWLIISGGKSDFPIKVWHQNYFQEVTDRIGEMGLGVVQTGANFSGHWHPKLHGDHVIDLVGWGTFREFVQQIYHAEGVICGITAAMHMAAALHKPCVVIGGGREAWWWEAYTNENKGFGPIASGTHPVPHRYLHTIGLLDCCRHHGCWKNKVVGGKSNCKMPIITPEQAVGRCMQMITPDHVMEAVMSYYTDKTLPPITPKPENEFKTDGEIIKPTLTEHGTIQVPPLPAASPISVNKAAKVVVRQDHQIVAEPRNHSPGKQQPTINKGDVRVMDHPDVGGKMTAFILFYGGDEYHNMHKTCLESFLNTTPRDRIDLRVGSNALCKRSVDLIEACVEKGWITKHYRHLGNDYKYPVMREMFHDPEMPITTKWVLWFDDDSFCTPDQNWLYTLCSNIAQHHKSQNAHMFGAKLYWSANEKQRKIMESRPWHRGREWRAKNGKPSPNGNKIIFATGGFWAITREAIVAGDIPDLGTGLTHNGGDWQIGEQLYQAGFNLKHFNGKKQFVKTSAVGRRGVTMPLMDKSTAPKPQARKQPPQQPKPVKQEKPKQPKLRQIIEL